MAEYTSTRQTITDHLSKIQQAGNRVHDAVPAIFPVFGLFFSGTTAVQRASGTSHDPCLKNGGDESCGEPRYLLLAGVRALVVLPMILVWMIFGYSLIHHPGFRYWMLGGSFIGSSIAVILLALNPVPLDVALSTAVYLTHLSFVLGYASCSTPFARRLDPTLSSIDEQAQAAAEPIPDADTQQCEKGSPSSGISSATAAPTKHSRVQIRSILTMLWLAASTCLNMVGFIIPDLSKPSEDGFFYKAQLLNAVVCSVGWVPFHAFFVWTYLQATNDLIWECLCGMLLGSASLASLRFTAIASTWQSWAIDAALAFVGMHVGLVGGYYSRTRSLSKIDREVIEPVP